MASSNASQSGVGGVDSDCGEEDQDDSSSSSSSEIQETVRNIQKLNINNNPQEDDYENALSVFREQWLKELKPNQSPRNETQKQEPQYENDEDKAKHLFLRGVELERSGKLYEAIQHYKRAMQIEPDVETRLYESYEVKEDTPEASNSEEVTPMDSYNSSDDEEEMVSGEDLLNRLQRIIARKGALCEPKIPTEEGHISWLPYEVLLLILRWVVSADLDAISLSRAAAVCRGLYVAARDPDIWRCLCVSTWGIECVTVCGNAYESWRHMYIERPHLKLHGCYISKTTYIRHGENAYQDEFYRPWHLIDYYRYLRFFPDGMVLTWTTADEPAACVAHLCHRQFKANLGIMAGQYRLHGDKVVIVVKRTINDKKPAQASNTRFRTRRKEQNHEPQEHTFFLDLQLRSTRRRRNSQLVWVQYSSCARRDHWTSFDLNNNKFPPFHFSPVAHYSREATQPLPNCTAYS